MIRYDIQEWDEEFQWDDLVDKKLKEVFLKDQFYPFQRQCINIMLSKKDLLVSQCSGYGKSLIYQLSSQISEGVTIVISPLISLIQDQVKGLKQLGIEVEQTIDGDLIVISDKIKNGQLKILYTTPEKIIQDELFYSNFHIWVKENKLAAFVIDEVHCISLWGRHFRNAFYQLSCLRRDFQNIPIIGLSATITKDVQQEILQVLGIKECIYVRGTMNRPNLFYQVIKRVNPQGFQQLIDFIHPRYVNMTGIVYCATKKQCEKIANILMNFEITAAFYHGDMDLAHRETVHVKWKSNDIKIIVATSAFGMGIDKSDVRFIVHYQMPQTIDSYIQESGRAGRDGKEATCLLMYQSKDMQIIQNIQSMSRHSLSNKQQDKLDDVESYCLNYEGLCRRKYLLQYFDEEFDHINCERKCDQCFRIQIDDQNTNFQIEGELEQSYALEKNQDTIISDKFIKGQFESGQKQIEAENQACEKTKVKKNQNQRQFQSEKQTIDKQDDILIINSNFYKCEVCQKIFTKLANLTKHSQQHLGSELKK